jgi:hypothetical protein
LQIFPFNFNVVIVQVKTQQFKAERNGLFVFNKNV